MYNKEKPSDPVGILMITQLFLPTKGGTAVSFDDDFRRLGGKEIHIVTEDVPGAAEFDSNHPNTIHRVILKRRRWLKPESLFIYTKLLIKSAWLAFRKNIGAVIAGRALPEGLVALIVARLIGRSVLIYAHGEELTGWGRGLKFRVMCFTLRRADWLLSNSDHTRDTLIDLIGVKPEHIAVVYPTVDENRFILGPRSQKLAESIGLAHEQALILSVGRLMARKGFDMVIRALPRLLEKGIDVHYAMIGIGNDLIRLQSISRESGMEERVHFLGHVSYEDLPRWYNTCDVFAMPNRNIKGDNEGFGLVFLEAAASGKPCLAGLAGGTGSAVVSGKTGLRVDGEKIDEVANGLIELLQDKNINKFGENGRNMVLSNFTHDRRVREISDLIFSRFDSP